MIQEQKQLLEHSKVEYHKKLQVWFSHCFSAVVLRHTYYAVALGRITGLARPSVRLFVSVPYAGICTRPV